jgi:hypothetical protein
VITKFNAQLKQLCAENASLHYLLLSEGFNSNDKCKLLANDGLHFNYRGISITAQSIVNQIEVFTSTPNSTFSFHPTSHWTSLPPLDDQSHFPELGLPRRKPGTISPYTPQFISKCSVKINSTTNVTPNKPKKYNVLKKKIVVYDGVTYMYESGLQFNLNYFHDLHFGSSHSSSCKCFGCSSSVLYNVENVPSSSFSCVDLDCSYSV